MHKHENQQANFEDDQTSNGGAAPENRRCQYIKADGKGCRDWAVRGQNLCYRHGVFLRRGRGIDVPLLEDEASIVLVLSETLRAVAQGTIALKSGSLLLEGCRLAHTMHMEKQKAANAERTRRRQEEREAGSQEAEAGSRKQGAGSQEEAGTSEPEPTELRAPDTGHRTPEICALRPEPCGAVLAAQAEQLDERMEEELAVGVR